MPNEILQRYGKTCSTNERTKKDFHGHPLGFHPQTQMLEPPCTAEETVPQESTFQ